MRRRTKRDLGVFLGAIAILGTLAFVNVQLKRSGLAEKFDRMRTTLERQREQDGMEILSWREIRNTKGSLRRGGTYDEALLARDGDIVNLMGFMVPQEQFRDVTQFMMLPIPIECYFCAMPPSRDIFFVELAPGEKSQIWEEPVLINGVLNIHQGPDVKYFYSLTNAILAPAKDGGKLTKRRIELQHMLPQHEKDPDLLLDPVYEDDAASEEETD